MEKFNVNEWIYYFFNKDEDALKELIAYYRPLVVGILDKKVVNFRDDPIRYYDCLSRADTLLVECMYRFHLGVEGSFTTFYRQCFINETINIIKMNVREYRHQIRFVSLESQINENIHRYNSDVIPDNRCDVHDEVITKLMVEKAMQSAHGDLSEIDLEIMYLRRKGFSNKEIGRILNKSKSYVTYHINKMKKYFMNPLTE